MIKTVYEIFKELRKTSLKWLYMPEVREDCLWISFFWIKHGHWIPVLTAAVVACTRSSQHLSMYKGMTEVSTRYLNSVPYTSTTSVYTY